MLTITNAGDKKYPYVRHLKHVYSHLSAGRAQPTPSSSPAVTVGDSRGLLVAGAVAPRYWRPQATRLENKVQDHRDDNGGDDGVAKTRIAQQKNAKATAAPAAPAAIRLERTPSLMSPRMASLLQAA